MLPVSVRSQASSARRSSPLGKGRTDRDEVVIRARPGGGTEHVERAGDADEVCVTGDQVRALAALGGRVETHYGAPQDTEWAFDAAGALWLTQAAPSRRCFRCPRRSGSLPHFCVTILPSSCCA